jgi:hypothetical protein
VADTRKSIRISDEAQAGWDRCSKRHGLPPSALLDALGQKIEDGSFSCPPEVVELAHQIEFERRSRRKK